MTKLEWLRKEIGDDIIDDASDTTIEFYYMAMHDHNLDLSDADRYGWLNTLFGYDIGVNAALAIINKYYLEDKDVMEIDERNEDELRNYANELKLDLNFDYFGFEGNDHIACDYMLIPKYKDRIDKLKKEQYTIPQIVGFIHGLYLDYIISGATETTLYDYADPAAKYNYPSEYWDNWDENENPLNLT